MRKTISWLIFITLYLNLIAPMAITANAQDLSKAMSDKTSDIPEGLQFRLSEGAEGAETRAKQVIAPSDPIPEKDALGLLKRLPDLKPQTDDRTDFAKRAGSLPPPKTGKQIPVKFPSDEGRGTPKVEPGTTLEVVRFSPEGAVPLAPDLSVTFSQPMVAVTSQEQAAAYAPVELSPQVEGRWRWLGTRTLMFDTAKRFPMATKFTARIPAGTRAVNGQTLQKDFVWTFTTPPPKVEQMIPANGIVRRDALMFISFDQAVNPESILRTIAVTAAGRRIPVRLATADEIASDSAISYQTKQVQPGRWIAFRAIGPGGATADALPAASAVTVTVDKGTPSAEGPLVTEKAQSFTFNTYSQFTFSGGFCGWQDNKDCSPYETWVMQFNNSIDAANFAKEMVRIEPAIEGLSIYPSGNNIYIQGYKKGRTTYKVTVDASLRDSFGQSLQRTATATIKVGAAAQSLTAQGGAMVILDPAAAPAYSIYSTNYSSVKLRLYKVDPADWTGFQEYARHINYDDGTRTTIPGQLIVDRLVSIANKPDELVETRIDLADAFDSGFGNVIAEIEPTVRRDKNDRTRILTWLQSTQIGLDAFVDSSELVAFATDLRTGKPLPGVELSLYPNGARSSQLQTAADEGTFASWWNWLWRNGPSSSIEAGDPAGSSIATETIEPAQSDRTGESGVLRLTLPERQADSPQNILIAKRGKDVAFLPENAENYWQDRGNWYRSPQDDRLVWFVFDDRNMYRPKEEVSVKGYIRKITAGKLGDVEAVADSASGLTWSVRDSRNNEIAKGTDKLNAFGAFDFKFSIPDNANLGYARIELSTSSNLNGSSHAEGFQIQEFRRPEFEVSTKVESPAPHLVGGSTEVSVEAKYYAGGGLANAETNWTVTASPTNYTPPNRGDFTFGKWIPWWRIYDYGDREYSGRPGRGPSTSQTFKGVTDASGRHLLKIDFDSVKPPRPYNIVASAAVQDVNRQTWSSSSSLLVHPSSLYIGIRTARTFVQKGEEMDIESIVTDIDGNLIAGRDAEIKAVLEDWVFDRGKWEEKTIDEQTCKVRSNGPGQGGSAVPAKCSFIAKQGGRYTVTATVMDDRERFNESEITIWVPGGKTPPKRNVEQEEVQIIPSKKDYAPGDVAELLVIAPFTPAEGVLTLRREGIVKTERFSIKDSSLTLRIPIEEKYLPNIYAQVDLVGAAGRNAEEASGASSGANKNVLAPRPAFASGNINLSISTASRKLTVSAEPKEKTLAPGGETTVAIEVKDSSGAPVANSEVAVVVVDESVLALSRYSIADPLGLFYAARAAGVSDFHNRKSVLLGNPADVKPPPPSPPAVSATISGRQIEILPMAARSGAMDLMKMNAGFAAAEAENAPSDTPINLRQNFNALAVFAPSVKTDSAGRATVALKLPDNLTRYRITAISVDKGKRFGKSESNITARQPLMVRPSAPRFMNFGDKIDLPVVVQNQTDNDMAVDVAIRATNAVLSEPGAAATGSDRSNAIGRRVNVKANSREEVRFPVRADKAGTAHFQIAVSSGAYSDAAEISLPIWTPATSESFATYGTTDENGAIIQPVQAPANVFPQFGGLEVTTSSTQLQELTDAFIYLYRYPYECSEQVASRMISIAALKDVLTAFKAKDMPSEADTKASFEKDLTILRARQRDDGSFGLWKRDKERYEYPFLTIHVAHALALSRAKGYKVPDDMLNKTKPYLKDVEKHFDEWYKNSPQVRWSISAYALYVRDMMGDKDAAKAKRLLAEATIEKIPFEALGWILSVLADDPGSTTEVAAISRFLMNRTTETAATANFVTDYGDGAWLIMYSNRRADGVLLESLIKADPKNDLIPKLVRGLLDHRTKGAWSNTQENVFILLALDKYFNAFEKVTPDFVARVWLGNAYAGEQVFRGRSIDSNLLNIPMSYLIGETSSGQTAAVNLLIDKQGAGRLYYRIGMKYAPRNLKLDPADYGFTVIRRYEAVDNADDVKQNSDGSWTIKSGARVRVRLTMVAQARRYHVALVDPLPAGLEILNPELAVTEAIPADVRTDAGVMTYGSRFFGGNWWWRQHWFEHQNFRDERAEAFTALLWEGVYNYTYVARATTPGQFVVPPAKAEEMYHPETFGRTGTDLVNVE